MKFLNFLRACLFFKDFLFGDLFARLQPSFGQRKSLNDFNTKIN